MIQKSWRKDQPLIVAWNKTIPTHLAVLLSGTPTRLQCSTSRPSAPLRILTAPDPLPRLARVRLARTNTVPGV